jgi:MHS family shikimate/dehydroshikimate transporter-like MFS transporter
MERLGGEDIGQRASIRQVAFASFIGTAIEWYDFFLYGTAAALVFNQLFFPTFAPLTGTLASFATFGVGFFARPVGGMVFGHFGDRVGRKAMLVITLLIMGSRWYHLSPRSGTRASSGESRWQIPALTIRPTWLHGTTPGAG